MTLQNISRRSTSLRAHSSQAGRSKSMHLFEIRNAPGKASTMPAPQPRVRTNPKSAVLCESLHFSKTYFSISFSLLSSSFLAGELAAAAHGNQAKKPERTRNRPNRFNEVAEAETSPSPPSPGKQKGGRRKAGGKYNTSRLSNTANATSLTHSTTSTSATTNQLTARKSKGEGSATAGDAAAAPKFVTATAPSANNPALQSSNGGGLEKYVAPMPRILMVNGDR